MILDIIPHEQYIAMFIAVITAAFAVLLVNYIAEYRDWKYKKQEIYVDALKKGESPEKPDLDFSWVYVMSLSVSVVIATIFSLFITAMIMTRFFPDSDIFGYFIVGAVVTVIISLYVDKRLARAIADGTFKGAEIKAEDIIVRQVESQFLKPAETAVEENTLSDELREQILAEISKALGKKE